MIKNSIVCAFLLILFFHLPAKDFGPGVSIYDGEELKWEEGAHDYFVMFKSLLADDKTCLGEVLVKPYYLDASNVPSDAYVERAFLIWTGAQQLDKIDEPADNSVKLKFKSEGGLQEKAKNVFSDGHKVADPQGFEFDAFTDPEKPDISYFTYRVDITDFFKEIHESGRIAGIEYDGYSLYGQYKVSGLDCSDGENTVSNWAIILVYSSKEISPKAVYLYDGFRQYRNETAETAVSGFELWEDPEITITILSSGGEPAEDQNNENSLEGFAVRGEKETDWIFLNDECNPETDVFNSISSVYDWYRVWGYNEPFCVGGDLKEPYPDEVEHSMDVDTFIMNSAVDGTFAAHFNKGGTGIGIRIGADYKKVITNTIIVAIKTPDLTSEFDVAALVACTPANIPVDPLNLENKWCYSDLEYTIAVKIQIWAQIPWKDISIKMELPHFMQYVSDSTEYANEFNNIKGRPVAEKWFPVNDLNGGKFPLLNGVKIADTLEPCSKESDSYSCNNALFLRFRIKIKDTTPKNEVFELKASIKTADIPARLTNLGTPLRLKYSDSGCVEKQEEVDLSACGGPVISENEDADTETADEDTSETKSDGCAVLFI